MSRKRNRSAISTILDIALYCIVAAVLIALAFILLGVW